MVQIPSMTAMFGSWIVYLILGIYGYLPIIGIPGLRWFLVIFLGGFVAGWIVWSIQIPRWRLWAYKAVENIDDLKIKAAAGKLIWPEGHIFQKTEIAPRRLREEIRNIEAVKQGLKSDA